MQSTSSIQHNDCINFEVLQWRFLSFVIYMNKQGTNGAEHHILFIWNKMSLDSTQLHMVEYKEMRTAVHKGI